MAKKVKGTCCICGQETDLTFEHIPPRAAFNRFNLRMYDFLDTSFITIQDIKRHKKGQVSIRSVHHAIILQESGMELLMRNLPRKGWHIIIGRAKVC